MPCQAQAAEKPFCSYLEYHVSRVDKTPRNTTPHRGPMVHRPEPLLIYPFVEFSPSSQEVESSSGTEFKPTNQLEESQSNLTETGEYELAKKPDQIVKTVFFLTSYRSWHAPRGEELPHQPDCHPGETIYEYRLFFKREKIRFFQWFSVPVFESVPLEGNQSTSKVWDHVCRLLRSLNGTGFMRDQIRPFPGHWKDCLEYVRAWEKKEEYVYLSTKPRNMSY